jgi:hypothetical protein
VSEDAHTREQLLDAIAAALHARDLESAAYLIRRLAVHWPADAELILATVQAAKGVPA